MSRSWRTVSKSIQKLGVGLYAVKSEGMFPYEMHYVLVMMRKSRDSTIWKKAMDEFCVTAGIQNETPRWFPNTSWRELIRRRLMAVFASYRPELHYMRGPGPKWHEKHTGGPAN
jgi:hypothetical protein